MRTKKQTWKRILERFAYKYDAKKPVKKQKIPYNFYEYKDNVQSYNAFKAIHFHFKNRLLVPAVWIAKKVLGKHLIRKIPKKPWNKNFQIFNEAIEESLEIWMTQYRRNGGPDQNRKTIEHWKKRTKTDYTCVLIRDIRDIVNTHNLNDSAYRELFNITLFTLQKKMNEYYNTTNFPNGVGHLMYADGSIYDPHYFLLFKEIRIMPEVALRLAKNPNTIEKRDQMNIIARSDPVAPKNP